MDNNEEHRQAVLNQGKMKVNDITNWLKMDNIEGNIDIGLNKLFEQTLIYDKPGPKMNHTEGNNDIDLNTLFEQSVMSDAQTALI